VRYCDDGELTIDNNVSERTVKMQAIGRKNWLFVGSREGGRRAAILFSLVASCKANGVEPWAYLNDLFTHLPTIPAGQPERLDAFLPDRWLATHPNHTWIIDDKVARPKNPAQPYLPKNSSTYDPIKSVYVKLNNCSRCSAYAH
jgi:IS66 C-terminal element/Transposase IS66 family